MKILYTPSYLYITEYDVGFKEFLQDRFPHYFEEEYIKSLVKINPSIKIGRTHMYGEDVENNIIAIYSGYFIPIYKEYKNTIELKSNIEKLDTSGCKVSNVLYKHQQKIVKECLKKNRGIIKSPTGSGKSFCIGALISEYYKLGLNILITVPTIDLLNQMAGDIKKYQELNKEEIKDIGRIGGGEEDIKQITVGIPNSLCKDKYKDYLNTVDVHIADECHLCATPTYSVIIEHLLNRKVSLAFSATPSVDGANYVFLEAFFGQMIVEVSEEEMINNNIILEPIFKFYPAPKAYVPPKLAEFANQISSLSNAHRYKVLAQVYDYVISNNTSRNKLITQLTEERINSQTGPVIIIVNKIKGDGCHGEVLYNMFKQKGIELPLISGYLSKKKRASLINKLKEHKIQGCIAGPKVLSAGINIPSLSTIVLAGAGRSNNEFIQRVGRLLRKKEGKVRPLVIDFIDSQYWFTSQSRERLSVAKSVYGTDNITLIK